MNSAPILVPVISIGAGAIPAHLASGFDPQPIGQAVSGSFIDAPAIRVAQGAHLIGRGFAFSGVPVTAVTQK